jgi:hypothetical protein
LQRECAAERAHCQFGRGLRSCAWGVVQYFQRLLVLATAISNGQDLAVLATAISGPSPPARATTHRAWRVLFHAPRAGTQVVCRERLDPTTFEHHLHALEIEIEIGRPQMPGWTLCGGPHRLGARRGRIYHAAQCICYSPERRPPISRSTLLRPAQVGRRAQKHRTGGRARGTRAGRTGYTAEQAKSLFAGTLRW